MYKSLSKILSEMSTLPFRIFKHGCNRCTSPKSFNRTFHTAHIIQFFVENNIILEKNGPQLNYQQLMFEWYLGVYRKISRDHSVFLWSSLQLLEAIAVTIKLRIRALRQCCFTNVCWLGIIFNMLSSAMFRCKVVHMCLVLLLHRI